MPGVASRLALHPLLTDAKPTRQRVINTYYDTPDQRLRRERVVVRHGKKGAIWLPSVRRVPAPEKRFRGQRELETSGRPDELDLSHVEDGSLRQWLESLRDDLRPTFRTQFTRSAWVAETLPTIVEAFPAAPEVRELSDYARRRSPRSLARGTKRTVTARTRRAAGRFPRPGLPVEERLTDHERT
ncbi:MAG: CYTH domain-containing protein [Candidatus Accumulibacter sp.]|nr:CYTH domain-containing protein [Accumulibacter sp.]MCM8594112.1 CYTH domain-containing protein [Accumulibacter sp.]MCM8625367.1 CYTH domain-containing protein [Accumulibacter sp.]MDS4048255.1 CYTH domain-containing protein [Accumulibacter sp.]